MPPVIVTRVVPPVLSSRDVARVETWRPVVDQVLQETRSSLSPALVLGVIYAESRGVPTAASGSASDWFSSFGLMQINADAHWRGTGQPLDALFDPQTNVRVGVGILGGLLARYGGDVDAAVSAYNGGGRRYVAGVRFCQVWRAGTPKVGRQIDRDCAQAYVTGDNEFGNQPYVDTVLAAAATFAPAPVSPWADDDATSPPAPPGDVSGMNGRSASAVGIVAVVVAALLAWLFGRGR